MYDDMNNNPENREPEKKEAEQKAPEKQVNTYDPQQIFGRAPKASGAPQGYAAAKPGFSGWKKGLVVFLIIALFVVALGAGCNSLRSSLGLTNNTPSYEYSSDYIGVLAVKGTISEDDSTTSTYNQKWLIQRIDAMMADPLNRGILMTVNTPGGSVYASDELYLKIMEYKESTGRPVYSYMESQATSGGYYISAGTDKIYANRNCWTGSIGVIVGTLYDISGLLENLGVKTINITSGDNKAMGSTTETLTDEQKEILQGLVDEAYEQFVDIVAEGRDMTKAQVRRLADGRIYTAKQAKENGLIDEVATLEDAAIDMMRTYELEDCDLQQMTYKPKTNLASLLSNKLLNDTDSESATSQYEQIMKLAEENGKFTVTYLSEVRK